MEVILKQRVFSSSLKVLGEEGDALTVDDATGKAMIEAGQAEAKKRSRRPAKDNASKTAPSRETR